MEDLTHFPNRWDSKTRQCKAIIETPKGRRNKFDYDPEYGLFSLGGLLAEGLAFPFDFGFIPSTLGGDGDPLDVMVLMDEPAHVGCLLDIRIIGVMEAVQKKGKQKTVNDRLIAVSVQSYSQDDLTELDQLRTELLDHVEDFFITYNKAKKKQFQVKSRKGSKRAAELLEDAIREFGKKAK